MNNLTISEPIYLEAPELSAKKVKAVKLETEDGLSLIQRREAVADFVAKQFAKAAIKMTKTKEEKLKKQIKFLQLVREGYAFNSLTVNLPLGHGFDAPFFSMVSVQNQETGETYLAMGFFQTEHELMAKIHRNVVINKVFGPSKGFFDGLKEMLDDCKKVSENSLTKH